MIEEALAGTPAAQTVAAIAYGRRQVSARFRAFARGRLEVDTAADLTLQYVAGENGFRAGGNLWIFSDVRQFSAAAVSRLDYSRPDGIVVAGPTGTTWTGAALHGGDILRTLDLYPTITEFLHGVHLRCTGGAVAPGGTVTVGLKTSPDGFLLPRNAIADFFFGLVEDPHGALTFAPVPGDRYWTFRPRTARLLIHQSNGIAVEAGPAERLEAVCASEAVAEGAGSGRVTVKVNVSDRHGNPVERSPWSFSAGTSIGSTGSIAAQPASGSSGQVSLALPIGRDFEAVAVTAGTLQARSNPIRLRRAAPAGAPGTRGDTTGERDGAPHHLYWGDPHGMMFNHRPLADYFLWARDSARLDWAGGQLFSYCTCVAEVWRAFKAVWRDFDQPGRFVSLPSAECGTPPDGSHRHWFLQDVEGRPPIFCEERAAAADPLLRAKFDPDTVYCPDYRALYRVVHDLGGFVHGHFHTRFYEGETLAEIYQKQVADPRVEEAKINDALRRGVRLGIVAGSDTHDSRPANPLPEPGGPSRPAGLTGVWAERLDRASLFEAFRQRRCYATTGQRLWLDFRVNGAWMGATVATDAAGRASFSAEILGTAEIDSVELVVNGSLAMTYAPRRQHVALAGEVPLEGAPHLPQPYCYLRVHQRDDNHAWSSPVWLRRA